MIITPLVHRGHLGTTWGIFAAGCAIAFTSIFGFIAAFTLRPLWARLFAIVLALSFLSAIAVLVVNAVFLNDNMNSRCANQGVARFSNGCEDIRDYNIVLYSVFFPLVATVLPTVFVAAAYLARTTSLYRKQEYDAYNQAAAPAPIGTSSM